MVPCTPFYHVEGSDQRVSSGAAIVAVSQWPVLGDVLARVRHLTMIVIVAVVVRDQRAGEQAGADDDDQHRSNAGAMGAQTLRQKLHAEQHERQRRQRADPENDHAESSVPRRGQGGGDGSVSVPVLSQNTWRTRAAVSIARPDSMMMPRPAARPKAAHVASGAANPRAQGQLISNTLSPSSKPRGTLPAQT